MSEAPADTRAEAVSDGAIRVRRALISVSDKTGVADFAKALAALGVEILSTGGTASALREAGLEVTDVSEFTGQEEILDGRVKTLHPRLHAALLARRDDPEHMATLEREGIEPIDLVCVNLYPFEQTVAGARGRPRGRDREHRHRRADDDPRRRQEPRGRRRRRQARVLRRGLRRAGGVAAARSPPRPATGSPTRPSPRPPATTPRSAAGSRPPTRTSPNTWRSPTRRSSTSPTARTRTSGRRSTPKPACAATSSPGSRSCTAGRSPSTTCSTSTRRGGLIEDFEPAGLHDRQAQQPLRGGDRRGRARRLPQGAGLRPGLRLRRRDRDQPAGRRRAGRGAARELRRGADRARLRGRRAGGAAAEGGDPHPLRRGAAPARPRRTRRQTGPRRPADPGPRRRPRAARADGGGDEDRAERGAVGATCSSPGRSSATSAPTRS